MTEDLLEKICETSQELREISPLTLCLTNFVTVTDCANAVLAVGASPIMSKSVEETEELVNIVNSTVLNIGTITKDQSIQMQIASIHSNDIEKPYLLDPVGVGISDIRNSITLDIVENKPSVIRGNMSEIKAIASLCDILDECTKAKGVDVADSDIITIDNLDSNAIIVKNIAQKLDTVIAVSGPIDIISDGKTTYAIDNGHEIMSKITGSGCMLSSIIGAYLAITNPLTAALTGCLQMAIAGEIAQKTTNQTGTFRTHLIDQLSTIDAITMFDYARIWEI